MRAWIAALVLVCAMTAVPLTVHADQMDKRLDDLFARLKETRSPQEGQAIESAIWTIWAEYPDERVERFMQSGIRQMNDSELHAALITFTRVIEMAPKFAEAWNKRATVYYMMQDYDASARDIAETLKLEPRHFGALSGLGLIEIALGRTRQAISSFEMALAHDPFLAGARDNIKMLKEELKGEERPI